MIRTFRRSGLPRSLPFVLIAITQMRIFSGRLLLPPRLDVSCRGCSHSPRGERPSPEKANSVPLIQANVIWGIAHTVKSGKCGYNEIYGKHDGACVSPLKSECTFYQSEIFSEQRYREALHTAIGDRMT
jgi:hypothetical protein